MSLSKQDLTLIDETLKAINGKSAEEKLRTIQLKLQVAVSHEEIAGNKGNNNLLKEIIIDRMPKICPQCQGRCLNADNSFCNFCLGTGEVNGVDEEKFHLRQIIV